MRNRIIVVLMAVFLVLGGVAIAGEEENKEEIKPEDIKLAIVDYWKAEGEISQIKLEGITYEEVHEKAEEKGYELLVEKGTLELFMDGVLSEITNLVDEDVTEEVIKAITKEEEIDDQTHFDEIEDLEEKEWIKDITEDVIEWFTEDMEEDNEEE